MIEMNKKGQAWTLPAILGLAGIGLILLPLLGLLSKWFILLGILFLYLAIRTYLG